MKVQVLLAILLFAFISCDNYAVLVAGSNTYTNYRHQSDIFHHYHILVDRGINPNNIIVFAYDDIANAKKILILDKFSTFQMVKTSMLV